MYGTNNHGREAGKIIKQVLPGGRSCCSWAAWTPNAIERRQGIIDELQASSRNRYPVQTILRSMSLINEPSGGRVAGSPRICERFRSRRAG